MEFSNILKELTTIVGEFIDGGESIGPEERTEISRKIVKLLDQLIIEGVALRSTGNIVYNKSEYNILKSVVLGHSTPSMSWLNKLGKEMPDLAVTLRFIRELDKKAFNSILWILDPES